MLNKGKRHFIVCYEASYKGGRLLSDAQVSTTERAYLNRNNLVKWVKEDNMKKSNKRIEDVIITNIIEVSEKEMNEFKAEK